MIVTTASSIVGEFSLDHVSNDAIHLANSTYFVLHASVPTNSLQRNRVRSFKGFEQLPDIAPIIFSLTIDIDIASRCIKFDLTYAHFGERILCTSHGSSVSEVQRWQKRLQYKHIT